MKAKLIRKIQRSMRTIISPSLDQIHGDLEVLQSKVQDIERESEFHRVQLNDLLTATLYSRWESRPSTIYSRQELGFWLNYLGLFGEGAEIGVYRGEFSELLLHTWKGDRLYSIDPWMEHGSNEYIDIRNLPMEEQNKHQAFTEDRLSKFGPRSQIVQETSRDASELFDPASLDFVFIDAQHHYEAVREDLDLWQDKVKGGGIIGGHDFLDGELDTGLFGVKQAVTEWSEANGYDVLVTRESPYPSWFVIKPST